jgi:hypothetical protein
MRCTIGFVPDQHLDAALLSENKQAAVAVLLQSDCRHGDTGLHDAYVLVCPNGDSSGRHSAGCCCSAATRVGGRLGSSLSKAAALLPGCTELATAMLQQATTALLSVLRSSQAEP